MTMEPDAADADKSYEELYIGPVCHVQRAEDRFGRDIRDDLTAFVHGLDHINGVDVFDVVDVDVGDDDDDDDDDGGGDDGGDDGADEDDESLIPEDIDLIIQGTEDWDTDFGPALDAVVEAATNPNHAHAGFPRIATTRNNLTALSQRYNLYFAAYQDTIHVYQPRRAGSQILPAPSLVLHPKPSRQAKDCRGAIDPYFGHQINHIIVGNLGHMEIVLFAYDDGDVAAYYTRAIHYTIARASRAKVHHGAGSTQTRQVAHPRMFFHENVGSSAWGLAIHEQSRLIAVGSNAHEVTVFAFAVTRSGVAVRFSAADASSLDPAKLALERHFRARTRTWRIILPLGPAGHNIPNVAFVDDEAGEANKVAAIDVLGNIWLLDIWKIGALPIWWPEPITREQRPQTRNYKGWGVLFLRDSSFKPTKTIRESLGVPAEEVIKVDKPKETRPWLDTTCSLYYVKELSSNTEDEIRTRRGALDYAKTHNSNPTQQDKAPSEEWETESESEDEGPDLTLPTDGAEVKVGNPSTAAQYWPQEPDLIDLFPDPDTGIDDVLDEVQLSRSIVPTSGQTPSPGKRPSGHASTGQAEPGQPQQQDAKFVEFAKAELPAHLAKHHFLLRTTFTDIELWPFDREAPAVECKYALTLHYSKPQQGHLHFIPPWDYNHVYAERVSMLLHVPELHLVIAGSPTGRVALVTLTKTARRHRNLSRLRYGFRIDRVLPRKAEDERALRPRCTLVGVAVSPVPYRLAATRKRSESSLGFGGGGGGGAPSAAEGAKREPVVYRLVLHYKDHRILMYDIARRMDNEELLVF